MNKLCFIPARMGSSRFPGKPLHLIHKKPLIQWVYEAASRSAIDKLYITTPDKEIIDFCNKNNFPVIKTSNKHERCLDRIYEAYSLLNRKNDNDVIICMQGDEPLISHKMIDSIIDFHKDKNSDFTVMAIPINEEEFTNPNIVKIAYDDNFKTIYTSRAPIPHSKQKSINSVRIFGLFALSPKGLKEFYFLPPSRLEILESCDTNRILGTNLEQFVCIQESIPTQQSVDIPFDAVMAEKLLQQRYS